MTRSNRTLNRLILLLLAVALLALAAALAWPAAPRVLPIAPPSRIADLTVVLWVAASGCAVAIVLALAWVVSRGRGGTRTAVRVGDVWISIVAVEHALRDSLGPVPSVISVSAGAHRLRRRTVVAVTVSTRRHADLPAVVDRVRDAVAELDVSLGIAVPILVRVASGWRAAIARDQRAE